MNKHPNVQVKVPMGKQNSTSSPWEKIAIDFLGPFPLSKNHNRFILIGIDIFSKFVLLKSLRKADSKSTKSFLENDVFLSFRVPSFIIFDNGSAFISKKFKKFIDEYPVTVDYNAANHPQHNPVERINRTSIASLRAFIGEDQLNGTLKFRILRLRFVVLIMNLQFSYHIK